MFDELISSIHVSVYMTLTMGIMITNNDDNNIGLTLLKAAYVPDTIIRIPNVLVNVIFVKLHEVSTVIICVLKMSNQSHRQVKV